MTTASEYTRAESVATNEQRYRKEWATLTGRSESEVYVPKGIRDDRDADPGTSSPPSEA